MAGYIAINRPCYSTEQFDDFAQKKAPNNHSCCQRLCSTVENTCQCTRHSIIQHILGTFPIINTIRTYNLRHYLLRDIVAGITVGMIHIPQGMGFAILSNLAPVYGLYTSFFPVVVYLFVGSGKYISMGTMAIISILVGSVVEAEANRYLAERGLNVTIGGNYSISQMLSNNSLTTGEDVHDEFEVYKASIASAMALASGAIMVALGLLKMGKVTCLMSQPFINGFTTGAAFHIVTSQMKTLLRIEVPSINGILKVPYTWIAIGKELPNTHLPTLLLVIVAGFLLVFFKLVSERFKKYLPAPIPIEILVLILATGFSHQYDFDSNWEISIIGHIPRGLPAPFVPPVHKTLNFLPDVIMCAALTLTIAVSMAEIVGRKEQNPIDANQEFIANGLAFGIGSMFYSFMGAAAPPRCFTLLSTGGKTTLNNLFSALLLLLVLVAIGPFFQTLPRPILATIIVVSLIPLFEQFKVLGGLWKMSKVDFSIWLITWLATCLLTMDLGLVVGIGYSILTLALTSMTGRGYLLGRTKHSDLFAPLTTHACLSVPIGVSIYRYESNLFFACVQNFKEKLFAATIDPKTVTIPAKKRPPTELVVTARASTGKLPVFDDVHEAEKRMDFPATGDITTIRDTHPPKSVRPGEPPDSPSMPHTIILDCSTFAHVDVMGINALKQISCDYEAVNIKFILASCTHSLLQKLELDGQIGSKSGDQICVYPTIQDALAAVTDDDRTGISESGTIVSYM